MGFAKKLVHVFVGLIALVLTLSVVATPVAAKKRFYLGGGLNTVSSSGGIDGERFFSKGADGPNVYPGKLADGSGIGILGGANIHSNLAVEFLFNASSHDSTHAYFPNQNIPASYGSLFLGGRGILPLGETFEIFIRGMLGMGILSYEGNVELPPSQIYLDSTFTGSGTGLGGGVRFDLGAVGIELSTLTQSITFNHLDAAEQAGSIDDLKQDFQIVNLIVTWNFGKEN